MTGDVKLYAALVIAVTAGVTALLRFLPFLIFRGDRKTPEFVVWLGQALPYAIMGMLVVFCLRNVSLAQPPHGLPELLSVALVAGLQVWRRNSVLSIVGGTACYMLLTRFVF